MNIVIIFYFGVSECRLVEMDENSITTASFSSDSEAIILALLQQVVMLSISTYVRHY